MLPTPSTSCRGFTRCFTIIHKLATPNYKLTRWHFSANWIKSNIKPQVISSSSDALLSYSLIPWRHRTRSTARMAYDVIRHFNTNACVASGGIVGGWVVENICSTIFTFRFFQHCFHVSLRVYCSEKGEREEKRDKNLPEINMLWICVAAACFRRIQFFSPWCDKSDRHQSDYRESIDD